VKYGSGAGITSSFGALGLDLRLISALPLHLADMAQFSVATGLRQANVTRLQRKQISLERRHLWVGADRHTNGSAHSLPLNQAAMDVLERRQGDHQIYVLTYEDKPVVQVNTKARCNALQRVGIKDLRWHDLRHTFATWHWEAGTPTHELQRLGGWETQSIVERYAHVAPEGLQFAASRLDSMLQNACVTSQVHLVSVPTSKDSNEHFNV